MPQLRQEGWVERAPVGRRNPQVIRKSFPHLTEGEAGRKRLQELIPIYGEDYRKPELAVKFNELALAARKQLKLV